MRQLIRFFPPLPGLLAIVAGCGPVEPPAPWSLDFAEPGRLAVIWHVGAADDALDRRLVIHGPDGARTLDVSDPREVRWSGDATLLVGQEVRSTDLAELPRTRLLEVPADGAAPVALGDPGRYYGAEPSHDGTRFAVGVDVNDEGDSALEIWSLEERPPRRLARREQNLDEPRWSPDDDMLLVARIVEPEDEEEGSVSFGGQSLPFPRPFALEAALDGPLTRVHDGERAGPAAAGGSLPASWRDGALWVRQRGGLARCTSPESGCEVVHAIAPHERLVEVRPGPDGGFFLLIADERRDTQGLPTRILLARDGTVKPLHESREDAFPLDLDWRR